MILTDPEIQARPVIWIAEDDEDDYFFVTDALKKWRKIIDYHWVQDGEQLILELNKMAGVLDSEERPFPDLIFLDINMPKKMALRLCGK